MRVLFFLYIGLSCMAASDVMNLTSFFPFNPEDDKCHQAVLAAKEYFKFLTDYYDPDLSKLIISYTYVDIENDLYNLLCALEDIEEKTIEKLYSKASGQFERKRLAFAYIMLRHDLGLNSQMAHEIERSQHELWVYTSTGFPHFPLGKSKSKLYKILHGVDNDTLSDVFNTLAIYNQETYDMYVPLDQLVPLLAESTSLEDFVRNSANYEESDVEYYSDQYNNREKRLKEELKSKMKKYNLAKEFSDSLKSIGFYNMTRGGEMETCSFISGLAVEALGYLVDIFGEKMVQQQANNFLGFELDITDKCAVKDLVCKIASVKSMSDLEGISPSLPFYKRYFQHIMSYLVKPETYLREAIGNIELVKFAKRIGIPNFPVKMTDGDVKILTRILTKVYFPYSHGDDTSYAQALKDATSMEDLIDRKGTWFQRTVFKTVELLKDKLDSYMKLIYLLNVIVQELEYYGLFMLY